MKPALRLAILLPIGLAGTAGLALATGGDLMPVVSSLPTDPAEVAETVFVKLSAESFLAGLVGTWGFGLSGRTGAFLPSTGDVVFSRDDNFASAGGT